MPLTCSLWLGATRRDRYRGDEDDQLLQYAIQQSLLEAGSENDEVCTINLAHFYKYCIGKLLICTVTYITK